MHASRKCAIGHQRRRKRSKGIDDAAHSGEPILRFPCEHRLDHLTETRWNVRSHARNRCVLTHHHAGVRLPFVNPIVGANPGDHLVGDDTDRILVRATVQIACHRLLGRHVLKLAFDSTRLSLSDRLGDPEVDNLHIAPAIDHDVARGNVAMDDRTGLAAEAPIVRVLECAANLGQNIYEQGRLEARTRHQRSQVAAVDVLVDDVALVIVNVEYGRNTGMAQGRRQRSLLPEEVHVVLSTAEALQDGLDAHTLLKPVRSPANAQIGRTHTAFTELLHDRIRA